MTENMEVKNTMTSHDNKAYSDDQGDRDSSKNTNKNVHVNGTKDINNVDDDEVDLSCGIGKLRTNICGRKFSNVYMFAFCVGFSTLFTEMVRQIISVQLTSMERQFNIDNTRAGLFSTVRSITFLSSIVFAGHFAKKWHIPFTVGLTGVIQGVVLMAPAFLQFAEPYELPVLTNSDANSTYKGDNDKYLCNSLTEQTNNSKNGTDPIPGEKEINEAAFILILCVQAFKGLTDTFHGGFLPLIFMDDNVLDKSQMSILVGIQWVIADLAGPIGKQINGMLSELPVDLKETDMSPNDPRFISAWWLSFLIFGFGTAFFSIPLLLFPRKLISRRQQREALDRATITFAGGNIDDEVTPPISNQMETGDSLRKSSIVINKHTPTESHLTENIPRKYSLEDQNGSRSGSRRPSLFPPVVGPTERKVSIAGDLVFEQPIKGDQTNNESLQALIKDFPKAFLRLLKNPAFVILVVDVSIISVPFSGVMMFRTVYMANEYNVPMSEVALASAISSAIGTISGTLISSWLCRKIHTKVGYGWINLISLITIVAMCPLYIVFGCDNQSVYGLDGEFGIPVNTSDLCGCDMDRKLLSCGDDGNNYLSPCYAGCSGVNGTIFTDCLLLSNNSKGDTVSTGVCPTDCHDNFVIYVALHGIQYFMNSLSIIPRKLLLMRIVDPQDRGFANGLFMFGFTVTGIPAPNLFGRFIDGTCMIWDGDFCALYDRDQIRYLLGGVDIAVFAVLQGTTIAMLVLFKQEQKKMKKFAKEDSEVKDVEMKAKL